MHHQFSHYPNQTQMGQAQKTISSSRRKFLSLFGLTPNNSKGEKVKLLTADGKLMEVDKAVLEKIATKEKASKQDILAWMNNPSKEK